MAYQKSKAKKIIKNLIFWNVLIVVVAAIVFAFVTKYDPGNAPNCKTSDASIHIKRDLYELCYNWQTKQPNWVLQFYDGKNPGVLHKKAVNTYKPDPKIPQNGQASAADYTSIDWILGNYLLPISEETLELTAAPKEDQYFFSLTSPQNPIFHSGYWKKLREYARDRALKADVPNYIGVLSGPLFLSETNQENLGMLDPNQIPVPTHFFQVIIPRANPDSIEAYIVPNKPIPENVPLDHFKYDLKSFERKTGIKNVEKIAKNLVVVIPLP